MDRYRADSNLLLRLAQSAHPFNSIAQQAVEVLRLRGDVLHVCPQNLIEFWAVASRPVAANGLGMTTQQTDAELTHILSLFPLLSEPPGVFTIWHRLVNAAGVSGKPTHDARLMAVAEAAGMERLLTFNVSDFTRFTTLGLNVQITDPHTL